MTWSGICVLVFSKAKCCNFSINDLFDISKDVSNFFDTRNYKIAVVIQKV